MSGPNRSANGFGHKALSILPDQTAQTGILIWENAGGRDRDSALAYAASCFKRAATSCPGEFAIELATATQTRWCSSISYRARSMSTFSRAANSVVHR